MAFPILLGVAWVNGASSALIACILFVAAPILGLIYQRTSRPIVDERETVHRGPTVKRLLQRGKPYALAVLVSDLCDRIDVFLFLWFTSFIAQGYYAASVPAANLLLVVPIALSLFAFNAGARRERKSTPRSVLTTAALILGVQLLAAMAFAVVLEPLMVVVFGESFRGAVPLTLNLLPAYAIAGCGRIAEAYLQGRNKAILGVISRVVGAVITCTVVYVTFDRWAELSIPRGALAGYVVSSLLLFTAILLDVRGNSRSQVNIAEGRLI
jgi:O-antigen/teichoic acid export membrane protein